MERYRQMVAAGLISGSEDNSEGGEKGRGSTDGGGEEDSEAKCTCLRGKVQSEEVESEKPEDTNSVNSSVDEEEKSEETEGKATQSEEKQSCKG